MTPETLAIVPLVALTLGVVGLGGGLSSESSPIFSRRWTRLSRCRPVLELVSIFSLGAAVLFLARG
jgi:hypothetical protein